MAERVHQVILNMLITKYLYNQVFYYMYTWGETLASIAWAIRAYYQCTILSTPGQAVFGRDMLFDLVSVIHWRVATSAKQRQVYIYDVIENARQVTHDYTIGYWVSVGITGIYRKLDDKKQGLYRTTEIFTNVIVRFQQGQVNKRMNIR